MSAVHVIREWSGFQAAPSESINSDSVTINPNSDGMRTAFHAIFITRG